MQTANSVAALSRMPLGHLLELYDAVVYELERMHEKGAADAAP